MVIMILSFSVIVIVTSSAIGRYSGEEKKEMLHTTAEASRAYINSMMSDSEDIESLTQSRGEDIRKTLDWVALNTDDITVILTDREGRLLLRAGCEDNVVAEDKPIPIDVLNTLSAGEAATVINTLLKSSDSFLL